MPLKAFWCLYKKISQIQASEDLHQVSIPGYGSTKEAYDKFFENTTKAHGHPVTYDTTGEKLDRKGLNELRRISNGR